MLYSVPKQIDRTLQVGDKGIVVWSLQRTCNKLAIPTSETGVFDDQGAITSAKSLQTKLGVVVDGLFGPTSQRVLAETLVAKAEKTNNLIPKILLSKVMYESGGYLGAVNWSAPGGVDCCITQRRVYAFEYDDQEAIKDAFDPVYQLTLSAMALKTNFAMFMARGVIRKSETGMRVAILDHNYPALAEAISYHGYKNLPSYYTTPQAWTLQRDPTTGKTYRIKFPDGHEIKTPLEWGQRYSLGNAEHGEPGQAVKLVDWSKV